VASAVVAALLASAPGAVAAEASTPVPMGAGDARALLEAAVASLSQAHVGRVSVVSFTAAGPRVADLDVRVDPVRGTELRRPTRWLLGSAGGSWLRTADGARSVTPSAVGARLDVDAVLARWDASVGPPRGLDTGPATPVHLVRREGTRIEEVVYVDDATRLPVRRETRGPDGEVLRVVAYTALEMVELGTPAAVSVPPAVDSGVAGLTALAEDGYEVPSALGGGFTLLGAGHMAGMAVARYSDGLAVLSVYQQHGRLDPAALEGAAVRELAGRDVWTWPGNEPVRLVWTGGDRTWTVVSDAPLAVIEDAVTSLPGDRVGHDVTSRITRGLARAWQWLRSIVGA
jgi:hypothetical protein